MTRVMVTLSASDVDPEQLERATIALRRELLELDIVDVSGRAGGEAPAATRAVDLLDIGNIFVTITQLPGALRQLVSTIRIWLGGNGAGNHTVELTIDGDKLLVSGVSDATQTRLIEAWLRAHGLDHVDTE